MRTSKLEVHARLGVDYISACLCTWRLAVPEGRISIGWFHAFSYSLNPFNYEAKNKKATNWLAYAVSIVL